MGRVSRAAGRLFIPHPPLSLQTTQLETEMGSVSRAAERLFIAQPPLSMQIKQLEDEIGVKLLIRYSRGVRLTAAGTAFLAEAKDLLARSERAKRLARHNDSTLGGAV